MISGGDCSLAPDSPSREVPRDRNSHMPMFGWLSGTTSHRWQKLSPEDEQCDSGDALVGGSRSRESSAPDMHFLSQRQFASMQVLMALDGDAEAQDEALKSVSAILERSKARRAGFPSA